jgi:hypothetical protein
MIRSKLKNIHFAKARKIPSQDDSTATLNYEKGYSCIGVGKEIIQGEMSTLHYLKLASSKDLHWKMVLKIRPTYTSVKRKVSRSWKLFSR